VGRAVYIAQRPGSDSSQTANLFLFVVDKAFTFSLSLSRPLESTVFTFFTLLRRPFARDSLSTAYSLHQNHHTMSVSGSRGTTYQDATSGMVSSIPEGGSLACKQCGALLCSLESLVSAVSAFDQVMCTDRSLIPFLFAYDSPIGDLPVSITLLGGVKPPLLWRGKVSYPKFRVVFRSLGHAGKAALAADV